MKILIIIPVEHRDASRAQFDALSASGNAGETFGRGASATGKGNPTHYLSAPSNCGEVTLAALPALKAAFAGSDYWIPPNGQWNTQEAFAWLKDTHNLIPLSTGDGDE